MADFVVVKSECEFLDVKVECETMDVKEEFQEEEDPLMITSLNETGMQMILIHLIKYFI